MKALCVVRLPTVTIYSPIRILYGRTLLHINERRLVRVPRRHGPQSTRSRGNFLGLQCDGSSWPSSASPTTPFNEWGMSTSMSPSAWLADFEALLKFERDHLAYYYGLSAVLSSSNAWGVVLLVKRGYGPDQVSRQHCICCVTCGSRELTNGTTRRVPQRTRDATTKRQ